MPAKKQVPMDKAEYVFDEWNNKGRPQLHLINNELTKLIAADTVINCDIAEIKAAMGVITAAIKSIVGNGEVGLIDKKIDKARAETIHDIATLLQQHEAAREQAKSDQWNKYKVLWVGGGVTVAVGVILNIIEYFKEFVLK